MPLRHDHHRPLSARKGLPATISSSSKRYRARAAHRPSRSVEEGGDESAHWNIDASGDIGFKRIPMERITRPTSTLILDPM